MINFQKLNLYRLFLNRNKDSSKRLHAFSQKKTALFLSHSQTRFFKELVIAKNLKISEKKFYITDTTKNRVGQIPTNSVKGIGCLANKAGENGIIFFSDNLHCVYTISKTEVNILVSTKLHMPIAANSYQINNICGGFIRINLIEEKICHNLNNILDFAVNKDNMLFQDIDTLKWMQKHKEEIANPKSDLQKTLLQDYDDKFMNAKLCLQAFLFIQLAKVITTSRISANDEGFTLRDKINNVKPIQHEVIIVDTLYDENIEVLNPFGVSGHFRNQPIGQGRNETKLIWIDSFMKSGYNRTATKTKNQI